MQLGGAGTSCNITLTAPSRMKPPIYLYYELQNYYQNHRRYVVASASSVSDIQSQPVLTWHVVECHTAAVQASTCLI